MKISVVIPTFNRKDYLRTTLLQLGSQSIENCSFAIVVVVDGSTDGTEAMLAKDFPNVEIVRGTGDWWFTKSLNEGIKKALTEKPDFILTLNDDGEIAPDFIGSLVKAYHEKSVNSLIGAISITKDKPIRATFSGCIIQNKILLKRKVLINPVKDISESNISGVYFSSTLMTRGLLIPVHVFDKIGFFDEKFPQYGSDEDFTLKANRNGFKCYVSWDAKVYDNSKLTSIGTAYNKPKLGEFLKSLFYKYSVNYLPKSLRFYSKHAFPILTPFYLVFRVLGLFKAYFFKYKSINK